MKNNIPLLENFTEEEIKDLKPRVKEFKKGSVIISEGDSVTTFGTVLTGKIEVCSTDIFGNRNIILSGTEGFVFGESLVVLGIKNYPVSVIAADECSIMLIDAKAVRNNENKKLCLNLMRIMAKTNIEYRNKITVILQRKTRDKIMQFLSDEAKKNNSRSFDIPFDRQSLADYLGVERSAMAAEISKLVKEGLIKTRKNHFTLIFD